MGIHLIDEVLDKKGEKCEALVASNAEVGYMNSQ